VNYLAKPILWVACLLFLAGSAGRLDAQPMSQYGVGLVSQPNWLQAQYYLRITNAFGQGTNIFLTYSSNQVFINVSGSVGLQVNQLWKLDADGDVTPTGLNGTDFVWYTDADGDLTPGPTTYWDDAAYGLAPGHIHELTPHP